ncbi:MAG: hypothetical protein WC523_02730 [Patescibacteria group bacterium]|jgi:hypothetical protein
MDQDPKIIDPRETRRRELEAMDLENVYKAVLDAEKNAATIAGHASGLTDEYFKLKKSRNWCRWFFLPLFLIIGFIIGTFIQNKYHLLPGSKDNTLQRAIDSCYAAGIKADSTIKALEESNSFWGDLLSGAREERDAYADSLADCQKGKLKKKAVTSGKSVKKSNQGNKLKAKPAPVPLEPLATPKSKPKPKPINQDSIDFFSGQPAQNIDDGSSNQTKSDNRAGYYTAPASSEDAFVKPTKYGVRGKKKTYSDYSKGLRQYTKQK